MSAHESLRLAEVSPAREAAYLDMVADFERAGDGYGWNDAETARADFAAFVADLEREARGEGLPPGVPAQITYILLDADGRALGEIRFRPEAGADLETLMATNGHIGYNVRPSARGQGYATRMLALALERVMLPVKDDNLASACTGAQRWAAGAAHRGPRERRRDAGLLDQPGIAHNRRACVASI